MICQPCRTSSHSSCPNITRLGDPIPVTGQYCACQHEPRGGQTRNVLLTRERPRPAGPLIPDGAVHGTMDPAPGQPARVVLDGGPRDGEELTLDRPFPQWMTQDNPAGAVPGGGAVIPVALYERTGDARLYPDQTWRWVYRFAREAAWPSSL